MKPIIFTSGCHVQEVMWKGRKYVYHHLLDQDGDEPYYGCLRCEEMYGDDDAFHNYCYEYRHGDDKTFLCDYCSKQLATLKFRKKLKRDHKKVVKAFVKDGCDFQEKVTRYWERKKRESTSGNFKRDFLKEVEQFYKNGENQ